MKVTTIPIHEDSRYAIKLVDHGLSEEELTRLGERLKAWWESGEKFLIAGGEVTFERIGPEDEKK